MAVFRDTSRDTRGTQHGKHFYFRLHPSGNIAIDIRKTCEILTLLVYINFLYSISAIQFFYNVLRPSAIDFTVVQFIHIFNAIMWRSTARYLVSV